jgi:RNA-splicing ligase RtcB
MVIKGKYNKAWVYTSVIEGEAVTQIQAMCDSEIFKGQKIRIMPDVHAGAGCVIGFTADLGERVIPNIVGVDIGCGMLTVELGFNRIDFDKLDRIIRDKIPSSADVQPGKLVHLPEMQNLFCYRELKHSNRI